MATEVALAAFSSIVEAAKYLFKQIQQETSYVFKYQSYIDGLKNQVIDLGYKRERVEQPVNHAKQQGDEIYQDVADWLKSVDDFNETVVKPINGDEEEAKKRCFKGSCPNLFKRYSLSKKAKKAAKEGADLLGRGNFPIVSFRHVSRDLERKVKELEFLKQRVEKDVEHADRQGEQKFEDVKDWLIRVKDFSDKAVNASEEVDNLLREGNFTKVSYRPAPDRKKHWHVKDYQQFDSRMKVFQQVMEALKDNKFNIIGVYGMGGVGKTTLVKQVRKQVLEDNLFDEVVMAEVTQTPDYLEIQNKFANDLSMKLEPNDSVHDRGDVLLERLKKVKKVLIVLDDIWRKFEFDDVGIPFENDEKERWCTIILTSRRQDLLSNQINSQKNFSIEVLSENEAWQLFEKKVGDSAKQSDFQPTAVEIVERCGGLPVALNTVAEALKNKTLANWKDALNQLRNADRREIPEMDAKVYSSIELSYNFLESDQAKSMFLLCGLFREGHPIKVRYLISYGMGLGLFKNINTLEDGRNRVHTLINSLKSSCLLLDGDVEDEVKMHDIIHVVAVSIAAEKLMFNITHAAKLKKEIEEIKQKGPITISLSCKEDVYGLPEQLECPQLKFLMFTKGASFRPMFTKGERSRPIIPDRFFEGMHELKVLHLDDIHCVPSLPSSLGCLINLQTLCLESCKLEDLATVGQLKNLEILSFRDSDIKQLPLEIGQLTGLQLLDLSNCWYLRVIAPNVISRLSRLEELYMDRFTEWEKADGGKNASLVELKGLSKLTTLEIFIPDVETIPQDLVSVELERHSIIIGKISFWLDKYKSSRLMRLGGLEKNIFLENHTMKILIKRTEYLHLEDMKGFRNGVHELDAKEGFPLLKHFHIRHCSEILHIVSLVERVHCKVFPLLESLSLHYLINLEKVCLGQLVDNQSFSNLRIIEVQKCVRLKHLFSFSMTKNLFLLQEVSVSDCDNLETIVGPDIEKSKTKFGINEIIAEDDPDEKVIFPKLEKLKLTKLPRLKSFVVGIKSVEVSMSTSEENPHPLFHEKIIFPSLEELEVSNCGRLKYLFSYSMVNNLPRLLRLKIFSCESMEVVVVGRDEGKLIEMAFPKLRYLELSNLRDLTSFAVGINSVAFPSLLKLEIKCCNNLRKFISSSSSEDNTQHFFDEKVALPNLTTLYVKSCNRLRSLMTLSIAERMVNLTTMKISYCEKLEEIIQEQVEKENVKEDFMVFSQLQDLELVHLPSLTCFYLGKLYTLEFSSLERVYVNKCPYMKTFTQGKLRTPTLHKVAMPKRHSDQHPDEEEYWWEGNLNPTIKKMFKEMVGFDYLQILEISKSPRLMEMWHGQLPSFFDNLSELVVSKKGISSAISMHILRCLNNLERLKVCDCASLEEVFHLEELNIDEHFWPIFRKLEKLELINLPNLRRLCYFTGNKIELPSLLYLRIIRCPNMEAFISNSTFMPMIANKELKETTSEETFLLTDRQHFFDGNKVALPNLMTLEVSHCNGLTSLMTLSIAKSMVNLKTVQIEYCDKLEEIIKEQVEGEKVVLPNLKTLEVFGCNRLTSLMTLSIAESMVNLTTMKIKYCGKLEEIIKEQDEEEKVKEDLAVALPNLKSLEVSRCDGLTSLMTLSIAKSMKNLTTMKIEYCDKLEEIIKEDVEGENEDKDLMVFSQLQYLKLVHLSSLTRFCLGKLYTLELSSLSLVRVWACPNMNTFSHGVLVTPKLYTVTMNTGKYSWEGNLNSTIQKMFKEMVGCTEKPLKLSLFPSWREIWHRQELSVYFNFNNLKHLVVDDCMDMLSTIPIHLLRCLNNLKSLKVHNCDSLEELFHLEEPNVEYCGSFFPTLEVLNLENLPKLRRFCNFTGNMIVLPFLFRLWIENCPNMEAFISNSTSVSMIANKEPQEMTSNENFLPTEILPFFDENKVLLPQLRWLNLSRLPKLLHLWRQNSQPSEVFPSLTSLQISECYKLEKIIQEVGEEVEEKRIVFNKLDSLKLCGLPRLTSFYLGNYTIELLSLSLLHIQNCPNMEAFISNSTSVSMIANKKSQEMTSNEGFLQADILPFFDGNKVLLPRLEELELSRLPKLLHLWRQNSQPNEVFPSLTILRISECDKVEKIIQEVGEEVKEERIVFNELEYLKLDGLPRLTSFYLGNYTIEFPSLERVVVRKCPNMKTFSRGVLHAPKLHELQVKEEEEDEGLWEGDLNSTIQQLFKEKFQNAAS